MIGHGCSFILFHLLHTVLILLMQIYVNISISGCALDLVLPPKCRWGEQQWFPTKWHSTTQCHLGHLWLNATCNRFMTDLASSCRQLINRRESWSLRTLPRSRRWVPARPLERRATGCQWPNEGYPMKCAHPGLASFLAGDAKSSTCCSLVLCYTMCAPGGVGAATSTLWSLPWGGGKLCLVDQADGGTSVLLTRGCPTVETNYSLWSRCPLIWTGPLVGGGDPLGHSFVVLTLRYWPVYVVSHDSVVWIA